MNRNMILEKKELWLECKVFLCFNSNKLHPAKFYITTEDSANKEDWIVIASDNGSGFRVIKPESKLDNIDKVIIGDKPSELLPDCFIDNFLKSLYRKLNMGVKSDLNTIYIKIKQVTKGGEEAWNFKLDMNGKLQIEYY